MRNILQNLLQHESVLRIRNRISQALAPLRAFWLQATLPVRKAVAPATVAWASFTAPLRVRWQQFNEKHPIAAAIAGWTGKLFKWGVYFLLFLIFGVWIHLFGPIPTYSDLRNIESSNATEVYTIDSVLIGKFYIENRTTISLDKISPHVINALVATEDRRFFEHSGIDYTSWLRVGFGMISGRGSMGGGSTLSQQLAKNLYPRRNYHIPGVSLFINKIRENFISMKLEHIYTKDELLNLYLNTVPFGGETYGISVASKHFFGKKAKDLSPDQAATLIGMLKATTYYNPIRNPENAKKRRNIVLSQMLRNEHLTQKEYETLSQKPVNAKSHTADGNNDGAATYFREYLRTEVMPKILKNNLKDDGTNYNLYRDGLKIYTTLHSSMQKYAESAVVKHMNSLQEQFDKHWKNYKNEKPWGEDKWIDDQIHRSDRWSTLKDNGLNDSLAVQNFRTPVRMTVFTWANGGTEVDTTMSPLDSVRYYFCLLNCGFMAMDHTNGYVRAWVGGTNFKYFKFDHVKSRRQVGSTFKPIVYAAALQKGVHPCDFFPNELVKLGDWEPHNSDETYGGYYSVNGALCKSVNVVAAQLIEKAGIEGTIQLAKKMGITSNLPREFGISLGATEVSLYDMIKVYGTIANKGIRPDPVLVLKVTTRKGDLVYQYKPEEGQKKTQALTEKEAYVMTRMMRNVIDYGTGSRFKRGYGLQGDFAGKTGTTQNQADGWFVCFSPRLVTGAWVGAESPAVRFRNMSLGQGSAMALPIVALFWHSLASDRKLSKMVQEKFPEPKAEFNDGYGCPNFIPISPDTFNLMMQDSVLADSLAAHNYENIEEKMIEFLEKRAQMEGLENTGEDGENKGEKRRDFFDKLIGRKSEDKPEKKETKGQKENNR